MNFVKLKSTGLLSLKEFIMGTRYLKKVPIHYLVQ